MPSLLAAAAIRSLLATASSISRWSSGVDIDFGTVSGSTTTLCLAIPVVRRAQQIFKVGTSVRVQLRTGTAGSGGNVFFCFFNRLGSSLGGKHR
jgi:hypothetical protein